MDSELKQAYMTLFVLALMLPLVLYLATDPLPYNALFKLTQLHIMVVLAVVLMANYFVYLDKIKHIDVN